MTIGLTALVERHLTERRTGALGWPMSVFRPQCLNTILARTNAIS